MKKSYQETARDLKKLGIIQYDLRKTLSRGQQRQIEKLRKEWGHALKHPELFHKARVSKDTAKELKKAGFKVTPRNVAVIPLHEFKTASVKKNRIIFDNGRGMKETTYLVDHRKFFDQLRSLIGTKLPRNKMVTVRIGDRNPFKRARFGSFAELYHYLAEDFNPQDPDTEAEDLYPLMSVVEIDVPPKPKKKTRTKEGYKIDPTTGEIKMPTRKTNAKKKAPAKKKRGN